MSPTLLLVRHAETAFNDAEQPRLRGGADIPIREGALWRFEPYAKRLTEAYPLAAIYSSPLSRARETAYVLRSYFPKPPPAHISDGLRPMDRGSLAGRSVKDVKATLDFLLDYPDEAPHGGESWTCFLGRVVPALRTLLKQAGAVRERGAIAAVTHGSVIDAAMAWHKAGMRGRRIDPAEIKRKHDWPGHALVWQHRGGRWLVEPFA